MLLGWGPVGGLMLAGITYISSSGVVSKLLSDLDRMANRETPAVLAVLVFEDLVVAAYLPVLGVLLVGGSLLSGAVSVGVALSVTTLALVMAIRFGGPISKVMASRSDEALLLSVMGVILVVGGLVEQVQVSSAIGAFLVGIALSGEVRARAERMLVPLRDLFAALFFVLFSLRIDPSDLPPVLVTAAVLAVVTTITKISTGRFAAGQLGVGPKGRDRDRRHRPGPVRAMMLADMGAEVIRIERSPAVARAPAPTPAASTCCRAQPPLHRAST
jgi:CPA2 family monovalent cation:H+ antiporter-2